MKTDDAGDFFVWNTYVDIFQNMLIFDIEKEKFAKLLPDECYDFPNKELDIQAGTIYNLYYLLLVHKAFA